MYYINIKIDSIKKLFVDNSTKLLKKNLKLVFFRFKIAFIMKLAPKLILNHQHIFVLLVSHLG